MFKKQTLLSIVFFAILLSASSSALPNPAAVYCQSLGYEYQVVEEPEGQTGYCIISDNLKFAEWDFYKGKVGKEYSYCAKKGYTTESETVSHGSYYTEQAVCVNPKGGVKTSMTELMENEGLIPMSESSFKFTPKDENPNPVCLGGNTVSKFQAKGDLPSSFDLRSYNGHSYISSIRNQGSCGSCYAFAAAATAEGVYNFATGNYDSNRVNLSESFILWCIGSVSPYSSHLSGCDGVDYDYYELLALTDKGITYQHLFPYTYPDPGSCTHWSDPVINYSTWGRIGCNDINAIKTAIMTYGIVDVAVYANDDFTYSYSGGIYRNSYNACTGSPCYYTITNHAVALVGWGNDPTYGDYWILRNSWGTGWGESGYMRINMTSAYVACEAAYLTYNTESSSSSSSSSTSSSSSSTIYQSSSSSSSTSSSSTSSYESRVSSIVSSLDSSIASISSSSSSSKATTTSTTFFTSNLYYGWNILSVPVNTTNSTASNALSSSGCNRIARFVNYGNSTSGWEQYYTSPVTGGTNFNITLGQGYFIKCDINTTLNFTGLPMNRLTTSVYYDWNLLSWTNTTGNKSASSVLSGISGAYRIARFVNYGNGTSGWEQYYTSPVTGGTDFTLNHLYGYFIKSSQNASWLL